MVAALLTYILRTAACLAVFYLFFKLLLSRETFHAFNRRLVLAATALAFVLPSCVITIHRTMPQPAPVSAVAPAPATTLQTDSDILATELISTQANPLSTLPSGQLPTAPYHVTPAPESISQPAPASSVSASPQGGLRNLPWLQIAASIYIAGVIAVILLTVRSAVSLRRLSRQGHSERLSDGTTLVRMNDDITPISWGHHILISEHDLSENGTAILAHEQAHVRLHHSLDLAFIDLAVALQWFNPAIWLLRSELRAIHEYEADAAVLNSGVDARSYQLLLIRKAVGGRWYSIANSFNHSKLKNRITMMLRKESSRRMRVRALLLLPLTGLALGAFAETAYDQSEGKVTKESVKVIAEEENIVSPASERVTLSEDLAGLTERHIAANEASVSDAVSEVVSGRANLDTIIIIQNDTAIIVPEGLSEISDEKRAEIEDYFNSDEWKQAVEKLEKMGEYFESDEWKQKAKVLEESGKRLEEYFNSAEWKQQQQELEQLGKYFESDEWKSSMKQLGDYFNSDEWKSSMKQLGDYFNSQEWKDTQKTLQALDSLDLESALQPVNDYFNSEEWQAYVKDSQNDDTPEARDQSESDPASSK